MDEKYVEVLPCIWVQHAIHAIYGGRRHAETARSPANNIYSYNNALHSTSALFSNLDCTFSHLCACLLLPRLAIAAASGYVVCSTSGYAVSPFISQKNRTNLCKSSILQYPTMPDTHEEPSFQSIRRSSFVDSYFSIKEEGGRHDIDVSEKGSDVSSLGTSIQPIEESNRSFAPFDDVDISLSKPVLDTQSTKSLCIDSSVLHELKASSSIRATVNRSSTCQDAQDTEQQTPPEFPTRRKGSIERRMLLKAGVGLRAVNERIRHTMMERPKGLMVDEDNGSFAVSRHNSTSNERSRRNSTASMQSLASFSSIASATSGEGVEVGNLTFVTDLEMLSIMYEDEEEDGECAATYHSLPPSAVLGKGATSMVRLAWRKTNKPEETCKVSMDTIESTSSMEVAETEASFKNLYQPRRNEKSRRSIIRVVSQPMSEAESQVSTKGDLVAVKLIQKSVLKQMKTMTKDARNRVTVQTAFDNIEREIAMMKRLQHPNLVRLFEVIDSVESDKLYMVLEYVSLGEILSHQEGTDTYKRMRYKRKVKGLTKDGHFDEENAALYLVDIMHGLAYLHRRV